MQQKVSSSVALISHRQGSMHDTLSLAGLLLMKLVLRSSDWTAPKTQEANKLMLQTFFTTGDAAFQLWH